MLPSAGTFTGLPASQTGKSAGKPQAAPRLGNGLVNGVAPVQVGESALTLFERSAEHTAWFERLTSCDPISVVGAANRPLLVSLPVADVTTTSPTLMVTPSALICAPATNA